MDPSRALGPMGMCLRKSSRRGPETRRAALLQLITEPPAERLAEGQGPAARSDTLIVSAYSHIAGETSAARDKRRALNGVRTARRYRHSAKKGRSRRRREHRISIGSPVRRTAKPPSATSWTAPHWPGSDWAAIRKPGRRLGRRRTVNGAGVPGCLIVGTVSQRLVDKTIHPASRVPTTKQA